MSISKTQHDLWEYLALERRPIALYGTGDGADKIIAVLKSYGLADLIAAVFASDGFVRDRMFHGYKVMSYADCCRTLADDFIVLVCFGSSRPEVLEQVGKIASMRELYVPDVPVYGNILFNREYYETNKESIGNVCARLEDDASKSCFRNYIDYKLSGSLSYLAACESSPDGEAALLSGISNGCYVDLGAYYGDTVKRYRESIPGLTSCVAIEPERHSFAKLEAYAKDLSDEGFDIRCINALVGSRTGTELVSSSRGRGTRAMSNSNVDIKNTHEIDVVTVDSLGISDVSFIKFDVEGSESEAIEGARETILRSHPVMKIACYHRSEDVFAIPEKVLGIRDDYKVFMRHTRCIPGWDTDFYFV